MLHLIRRVWRNFLAWHPAVLTVTRLTALPDVQVLGTVRFVIVEVDFDGSYPTGGEALTAATLGLTEVVHVIPTAKAGFVFEYDYTNSKLLAYWVDTTVDGAAMAEVADTTDLDPAVVNARLLVLGR